MKHPVNLWNNRYTSQSKRHCFLLAGAEITFVFNSLISSSLSPSPCSLPHIPLLSSSPPPLAFHQMQWTYGCSHGVKLLLSGHCYYHWHWQTVHFHSQNWVWKNKKVITIFKKVVIGLWYLCDRILFSCAFQRYWWLSEIPIWRHKKLFFLRMTFCIYCLCCVTGVWWSMLYVNVVVTV